MRIVLNEEEIEKMAQLYVDDMMTAAKKQNIDLVELDEANSEVIITTSTP